MSTKCTHKLPLTEKENDDLNKAFAKILQEGFETIQNRFKMDDAFIPPGPVEYGRKRNKHPKK